MEYRLSDLFELQMGKTPDRSNTSFWNNGIFPWISISDLSKSEKYILNTVEYITQDAVEKSGIKRIPANTVVMSFKLSIGKVAITSKEMYSNEAIMAFIDKGIIEINSNYLFYLLKCRNWDSGTNKAVMGKTLNKVTLSQIKIYVHNSMIQKEIVEVLDKVNDLISKRKKQLELLNELVQARFIEMFGDPVLNPFEWQKNTLETNATLLNGRAYSQDELLDSGKYPVLRVGNFFSNRGWYYSDLELEEDKYCDNGDLLYAWSASFGPQIWHGGKVIYHYHIWKVLVGNAYNKLFLCKLLEYTTESFMGETHGIAMLHLTKSGMEKTEFIVPPLALQEVFAAFVTQIDKSKAVIQKSIDELQILFDSLMQKYFG